jgi:hypothetical protein
LETAARVYVVVRLRPLLLEYTDLAETDGFVAQRL